MTRKLIAPILWLIFIYVITALAEDLPPPGDTFWAHVLDELKHVSAHSLVYGVMMLLLIWSIGYPGSTLRDARPLLILIFVFGVGQELLQVFLRHRVQWIGSPWDLTVDVSAAALAFRLAPSLMRWRLRLPFRPLHNPVPNE
jgi:hypothetical protein